MSVFDKKGVLDSLESRSKVEVEIGCGNRKRNPGAIGIDLLDYDEVDIVGDVMDVLKKFPDGSVDLVSSHHVFEHLESVEGILDELSRLIKVGGELDITVPHFSNPYFYSDPTHTNFFGLYTFSYLASCRLFKREVPNYQKEFKFSVESVTLGFKSPRPFYFRYAVKRCFGWVINQNSWLKEFYEENLCYLFPCYEIRFLLKRLD